MGGQHMKPLSILSDEKKLDLNNSGTVLLARLIPLKDIKLKKEFQELFPLIPANVEKITMRIKRTDMTIHNRSYLENERIPHPHRWTPPPVGAIEVDYMRSHAIFMSSLLLMKLLSMRSAYKQSGET